MNQLAAVSDFDHAGSHVFAAVGRGDEARTFRAAVRHSRQVRFLRIAIPATTAIAVLAGVVANSWFQPLRALTKVPIELGSLVVSGTKITMQQPRLAGFTADNRQYELTAQAAYQDLTKPGVVELQNLRAIMEMQDRVTYNISAKIGVYNSRTEMLTLQHNIVVTSSDGFQARLNEAAVDIKGGKIVAEKAVEVKGLQWTVTSDRLEVTDSGAFIRFDRGVTMTLMPIGDAARLGGAGRTQ
jgi:lipopolysaccharide export system protein LptC